MKKTGFWSKHGGGAVVHGKEGERWMCQSCGEEFVTKHTPPIYEKSHIPNEYLKVCNECKNNGLKKLKQRVDNEQ